MVERLPPSCAEPFRSHAERKQQAALTRRRLGGCEHDAGFGRQRKPELVDFANTVQPRERQQDLAAIVERRRAAAIARVAALRHDADSGLVTNRDDAGALRDGRRPHDQRGRAAVQPALVIQQADRIGRRDYAGRTDHGRDLLERCAQRLPMIGHGSSVAYAAALGNGAAATNAPRRSVVAASEDWREERRRKGGRSRNRGLHATTVLGQRSNERCDGVTSFEDGVTARLFLTRPDSRPSFPGRRMEAVGVYV